VTCFVASRISRCSSLQTHIHRAPKLKPRTRFRMGKLMFPFASRTASYYQDTEVLPMATKSGKRELIDTGTDKRFVKRDKEGKFK